MKPVRIGLIQMEVSDDLRANTAKAAANVREAARQGARIVCLAELYRSRYFPHDEGAKVAHLAETVPGESTDAFSRLAKELETVIIVPVFEKTPDGRFFNTAAVIDADGALLGTYRKTHVPYDEHYYEKSYFEPGDGGYRVHKTRYAALSVLICYDQWFPEAARASALLGAEILFYPTAIGWIDGYQAPEGDWREAWTTIQRAHAIANGVHVAAVNRAGAEGKLRFWGSSFICDSFGNVVGKAGEGEEVLVAKADLDRNKAVREEWGFLRNRRPDTYAALAEAGK
ncbi:MAG: carbon-nitrogen hydrolase [Elusimicrobiota bacterium]